jgi:hypothetical protein
MAGKTLDITELLRPDNMALRISEFYQSWNTGRQTQINDWNEIRRYVTATDTTSTSNAKLPWKNKTTLPKLCQIRDNLIANYMAALFPKRKWLKWVADDSKSGKKKKREAIENYVSYLIDHPEFKNEIAKMVHDYVDYGNVLGTVEWIDSRQKMDDGSVKSGFVGPAPRRISPIDMVFNPIAPSFTSSPKIEKTVMTIGEFKAQLDQMSQPDNAEELQNLFNYLMEIRREVHQNSGDVQEKDSYLSVDGFTSFRHYLTSDYIEVLTFYGDLFDVESGKFYRNHIITVADRHKLISVKENPSHFGSPAIYHSGWRLRQDNLWAMGPLDNLVGIQYRIDHIENLKADLFDLITFPPIKIKGFVEDFTWGPMEKIVTSEEGDVELMAPQADALNANLELQSLMQIMEEMAGAPKEAMGIRSPGEKTAYEVQRLESAAGRIFQAKITQFEEQILEPILNAMLEMGRRKLDSTMIHVFDDEFKIQTFMTLTADDITGNGRIKPYAARHFAERAERVQNLNNFFQSALGADPEIKAHFSSIQLAKMFEDLLEISDFKIVVPYIRLSEQAEAQRLMNSQQEQVQMEAGTPSGLAEDDIDLSVLAEDDV